ncbi:MAG: hypothetical protein Kow00108_18510 [Calditrichia bacterium]
MKLTDKKRPRRKLFEKQIAKLFFKHSRELLPQEYQDQVTLPIEDVIIESGSLNIHGWRIPVSQSRGNIVFYHGTTATIRSWLLLFHYLHKHHYTIYAFDYPGYGKSNKSTSFSSFMYDAAVINEWLQQHLPENESVILYGHSFGCYALQQAIFEHQFTPQKIILQSPILSIDRLLSSRMPSLFRKRFHIGQFNLDELLNSDHPLHVFIGDNDPLIPDHELNQWKNRAKTDVIVFPGYKHASFINPKPGLLDPIFK